jgi:hypothetical protein
LKILPTDRIQTGSKVGEKNNDEYASDELDYIVPAASQFSCVSQIKGEYMKFISSPSAVYMISAFYWEYLSDDDLCLGG